MVTFPLLYLVKTPDYLIKFNISWGFLSKTRSRYLRVEKAKRVLYRYFKTLNYTKLIFFKLFFKLKHHNRFQLPSKEIPLLKTPNPNTIQVFLYKGIKINIVDTAFLFQVLIFASIYRTVGCSLSLRYQNLVVQLLNYYFQTRNSLLLKNSSTCKFNNNITFCYNPTYFKIQPVCSYIHESFLIPLLFQTQLKNQTIENNIFNNFFLIITIYKYCFTYIDNNVDKISLVLLFKSEAKNLIYIILQHLKNFLFFYDLKFLETYGLKFLEYCIFFNLANLFYFVFGFANKFKNYLNSSPLSNKSNSYKGLLKQWLEQKNQNSFLNPPSLVNKNSSLLFVNDDLDQSVLSKIHNINTNTHYSNYLNSYKTKNFLFNECLEFYIPK